MNSRFYYVPELTKDEAVNVGKIVDSASEDGVVTGK
jgi:hypothetical protein